MVSVGVLSSIFQKGAIWVLPATFVMFMAIGGIFGLNGFVIAGAEMWVAASLVALGLAIAASQTVEIIRDSLPLWVITLPVAVFGIAHGNAHGLEIPQTLQPVSFTFGFLLGTSALHLIGVGLGVTSRKFQKLEALLRAAGLFVSALGVGMLTR